MKGGNLSAIATQRRKIKYNTPSGVTQLSHRSFGVTFKECNYDIDAVTVFSSDVQTSFLSVILCGERRPKIADKMVHE